VAGSERLKIALAQLDLLVGDVRGNLERVIRESRRARDELQADLVLFPELTLSGYPPEDLLFHRGLRQQIEQALQELTTAVPEIGIMVGYPEYDQGRIFNAACLLRGGRMLARHRKACLPNYKVFDEKRYFTAGSQATLVDFDGVRIGLLICEDAWEPHPAADARALGAEVLLIINASPYEIHKQRERERVIAQRVRETGLPAAYVNLLGGQDELVFDGNSFAMDAQGRIAMRAPPIEEGLYCVEFERTGNALAPLAGAVAPEWSDDEIVYRVLVLGVRDYVNKHGFTGAVIGLSGGIDSALTLARARGHDAVALYLADEPRGRGGAGAGTRRNAEFHFDREHVCRDARRLNAGVRGTCSRCHRREHTGPLPRRAVDGDLEQNRPHAADHRQQERDGGGLRHAVRRHGGRIRAHQGLQQAAGLPPRALPQFARKRYP
jgi:NAD+ synthase (glutamine-hydrolysing)